MDTCIFCKIVNGEIPSFKVYEDEMTLAFMDINPISPGHTLIIPKKHARDLWEISAEDLTAVHLASRKVIQAIRTSLNPSGVACIQLNGPGANQVVLHYHLHLVPRTPEGPELPVATWELKQGETEAIKGMGVRIAGAIR